MGTEAAEGDGARATFAGGWETRAIVPAAFETNLETADVHVATIVRL